MFGRKTNKEKTHCPKGHPYDLQNTYITKNGGRQCKECKRQSRKGYDEKKKGLTKAEREGIWAALPVRGIQLSPGDYRDVNGVKTHCQNGHPFDRQNTYIGTRGERVCFICRTEYKKSWQHA